MSLACVFCSRFFETEVGRAFHYIAQHRYNKEQLSIKCPLCNCWFVDLLSHFDRFHLNYCVFCARQNNAWTEHVYCASILNQAMKLYIDTIFD